MHGIRGGDGWDQGRDTSREEREREWERVLGECKENTLDRKLLETCKKITQRLEKELNILEKYVISLITHLTSQIKKKLNTETNTLKQIKTVRLQSVKNLPFKSLKEKTLRPKIQYLSGCQTSIIL